MKKLNGGKSKKKDFDNIALPQNGRFLVIQANVEHLQHAMKLVRSNIPENIASTEVVSRIIMSNKDSIYTIHSKGEVVGVYAMLLLNKYGEELLLKGDFNPIAPDCSCLAQSGAIPSAIYKWVVVAPGMAAFAIRHISFILQQTIYKNATLYARPSTVSGQRIMENLGFKRLPSRKDNLYSYTRRHPQKPSCLNQDTHIEAA